MNKFSKKYIIVVIILSLGMVLASCGGAQKVPAEPASFTLGSSTAFDTLNPLTSYMQVTYEFFMLIYDSLVLYDENFEPCTKPGNEMVRQR